jgi:hypothetical protein
VQCNTVERFEPQLATAMRKSHAIGVEPGVKGVEVRQVLFARGFNLYPEVRTQQIADTGRADGSLGTENPSLFCHAGFASLPFTPK